MGQINMETSMEGTVWLRKVPACLFSVLIAYDEPRLCMNIHYYVLQLTLTGSLQCTLRCAALEVY